MASCKWAAKFGAAKIFFADNNVISEQNSKPCSICCSTFLKLGSSCRHRCSAVHGYMEDKYTTHTHTGHRRQKTLLGVGLRGHDRANVSVGGWDNRLHQALDLPVTCMESKTIVSDGRSALQCAKMELTLDWEFFP